MSARALRQFYFNGFEVCRDVSKKQVKIRRHDKRFITLNRFRARLHGQALKRLLIHHAPVNVYSSVLEWLMPERVREKPSANRAYPIGGEYVVDIDVPQMWRPWNGHETNNLYAPGLRRAYDRVMEILDKIGENYTDIKSHEVARFIYTHYLQSSCVPFSKYHFVLSSDPMRVMTVPGSLNGETGLVCFEVGDPAEFEKITMKELVVRSDARKHLYNTGFHTASDLVHAHPEPSGGR